LLKFLSGIILGPKERERRQKTMTTRGIQRIEFRPERDILGKTIERNTTGFHHLAGLKGF
jgi:hypothetical protein